MRQIFPPLAALPDRVLERIGDSCVVRTVPAGTVLFEEHEPEHGIFQLLEGRLSLQHRSHDSRARTVCQLLPHGLACCVTALDAGPYPATAVAAVDSTVCCIGCSLLRELMRDHPRFAEAVTGEIGRQLRWTLCAGVPHGDAGARIANRILAASVRFGRDVPLTRRELAEMAGTAVETAIRETRKFEKAGWIALRRGHVRVLRSDALDARARRGRWPVD